MRFAALSGLTVDVVAKSDTHAQDQTFDPDAMSLGLLCVDGPVSVSAKLQTETCEACGHLSG